MADEIMAANARKAAVDVMYMLNQMDNGKGIFAFEGDGEIAMTELCEPLHHFSNGQNKLIMILLV